MSTNMRRQLSPTTQLLRSSRLFSIPTPLPPPNIDIYFANTLKSSKTATIPYPTHQAIATPASSLGRGDWGLKRPLPLKSTNSTSRPVLRILANDTIEHITDFDSAQDHVQTLLKWQEMGVALSNGGLRTSDPSQTTMKAKGVFERLTDSTDNNDEFGINKESVLGEPKKNEKLSRRKPVEGTRWRHQGPWLAGMDDKAFKRYMRKEIAGRREEFEAYFFDYVRRKILSIRRAEAQRKGLDLNAIDKRITREDVAVHYRLFRKDVQEVPVSSELVEKIIIPFLDLPPVSVAPSTQMSGPIYDQFTLGHNSEPLSTHPSAGLSYLRTNSTIYNHPLLGPQKYKQPVPARVLIPARTSNLRGRGRAILGVAGIAVDDSETESAIGGTNRAYGSASVSFLDTETVGGKKLWVSPVSGSIMPDGKIKLEITRAPLDAVAVGRGELEELAPPGLRKAPTILPLDDARLDEPLA